MTTAGLGDGNVQAKSHGIIEMYAAILFTSLFHLCCLARVNVFLFTGLGFICLLTQTRDIRQLVGLIRLFPITMIVMTLVALAMAGFPFLNGFISIESCSYTHLRA
ncbi:proton-conducting transporter membrane subunit, partial [Staphylococcus felis]|uniref:proton-conducting transporter transmembrane domain-containing protein n=1 Tax=Staphylococcus felis TaxID=46127 RepID=UPI000E3A4593